MIGRHEIDAKALEFEIHPTNVERDYVFGWLLYSIKYLQRRDGVER